MRALSILLVGATIWATPLQAVYAEQGTVRIAMVLWRGETPAEHGFREGLAELGYSAQITVLNAGQDKTKLGRLLRESLLPRIGEFDYVYTFGTTVSKATQALLDERLPQVFNIVSSPVEAGLVDSMESPGRNISGVSSGVPIDLQLEAAFKVIPVKKLGLLFNPRERNSMIIRERVIQISHQSGFEVIDLRSPPARNSLAENLDRLADGTVAVDAVYLPSDSFLVSNAELIGSRLTQAGMKSIGALQTYIAKGALLGVVADYHELGRAATTILDRHRKGEPLASIPVASPRSTALVVNRSTSRELGVKLPPDLKATYLE